MTSRARRLSAGGAALAAALTLGLQQAPSGSAAPAHVTVKDKPGHTLVDPSRPLVISEFRVRGPNGANDEFIEITNIASTDHTVAGGGTGYALAASNGVARCVVPNGVVIPAWGSYLCVNSVGYSLASYPAGNGTTATGDATYTTDIPDNAGIALFNTSVAANFTLANRLDAVGSTSEANVLYKEGTGYPALVPFSIDYSFYRNLSTPSITSNTPSSNTPGIPQDTENNAVDFVFVDTNGTSAGAGQRLGAPGPANLSSPTPNGKLDVGLLDPCVSATSPPNAVRDFTSDPANNSTFGTTDIRRTITNNTGGNVTRLRLRVDDIRTFPAPSGTSDLRPRTSTAVVVTVDRAPCGSGTSNVTVNGTTLEQPPGQPNGGGFNSSLSAGTITLATPLANGASVDVRLLLGIQQTGIASIRVTAEALTGGDRSEPGTGNCLPAPSDGVMDCGLTNSTDIAVPGVGTSGAANPYPSTIDAEFPDGYVVTDLNVRLDGVTHTFPGDIDAMLVAPDGTTNSLILSDTGSTTDISNVALSFDDEAPATVPTPIVGGTYKPTETAASPDTFPAGPPAPSGTVALSNFDGISPDGDWKLYVNDDAGGDAGSISSWSMDITAAPLCDGKLPTIVGTEASDTLTGTSGDDVIAGLGGNDVISGDDGNDTICGGEGSDEIRAQLGADKAFGQNGDDAFIAPAVADAADLMVGGAGIDLASYAARSAPVSLTLNGAADDGATGEHDRIQTVENLTGGEDDDFVSGNSLANELLGKGGADKLRDFPGVDQVFGGAGDDTFVAPSNPDSADDYNGGADTDKVLYNSRAQSVNITLAGAADDGSAGEADDLIGIEDATGGGKADTIVGTAGPNTLLGGGAGDTITDGPGADDVNGGGGNDTFVQAVTVDNGDTFNGGPGTDTINYSARNVQIVLTLGSGTSDDGAVGEGDWLIAIENAFGGTTGDTLNGSPADNVLRGGGGSDVIKGFGGADQLFGDDASDALNTVDGVGGNDTANGGLGADTANIDPGDILISIP
ncbi:hypothetical protein F0U44_02955 [Nocardioides humilatus]|uniref:P/Homo B domain-containing protein n=1 Tax=Nocardioides humilatus TaxID=2607660 RepID=A0A5B1LLH3_9ACTN|nr:hypothetical protein [Nocardioides humilatus]KAA1421286.1 hypothetical protein F0U44_02955 [Nocardioides humilatus]